MEKYTEKSWQFKVQTDENKDALDVHMKAWGLGVLYRTMMSKANPIIRFKESKKSPGKYILITRSQRSGIMIKRFVVGPFELNGEEIDETRADGKKFKTSLSLSEDGILTLKQRHDKGDLPDSVTTREILEDGSMKVIADCAGNIVTRIYVPEDHVESKEDEEL
ncbi:sodium/calcium exchanger regulatory protein 1-like [Convolutriloba macropyga]|uniref:sodium/calcium exchanger regulatory protein 1-like n=1 Tax=Convolutriloba macropyga TaxID=536237 RepID=UPI003F5234DE